MAIKKTKKIITDNRDVPATHTEVQAIKKLVSSQGSSLRHEMKSIHHKFESLESKIESRFKLVYSKIDQLSADMHKTLAIVEEQNSRNKVVMDSQAMTQFKIEEIDNRLLKVEKP